MKGVEYYATSMRECFNVVCGSIHEISMGQAHDDHKRVRKRERETSRGRERERKSRFGSGSGRKIK